MPRNCSFCTRILICQGLSQKGPLLRISDLLGFDHTYMRVILPYAPVPCQISATILVKARCGNVVPYPRVDDSVIGSPKTYLFKITCDILN